MKKVLSILFGAAFAASMGIALVGCNEEPPATEPAQSYSITLEEGQFSDYYDLSSNYSKTTAGTEIVITVEQPVFATVAHIYANGEICQEGEQENSYTFTMPSENVVVTADFEILPDIETAADEMMWTTAPTTITAVAEDAIIWYEEQYVVDFGSDLVLNNYVDGGMSAVRIFSTNQDVIPDSAISKAEGITDSAYASAAEFTVDLRKVSPGTATIVFVERANTYYQPAWRFLSKTITVLPVEE